MQSAALSPTVSCTQAVLKVRKQGKGCQNTSLISTVQNEGAGALYSGLSIEVARGTFSAGLMLTVKEKIAAQELCAQHAFEERDSRSAQFHDACLLNKIQSPQTFLSFFCMLCYDVFRIFISD